MANTTYAGIDYGLGQSNIDRETGIRYGVISQNSVNLDIWSEAEPDYGQPHCPECGNEIKSSDDPKLAAEWDQTLGGEEINNEQRDCLIDQEWFDHKDYTCLNCEQCFSSDSCFPDEALRYTYEQDGYQLTDCLDSYIIFVLKSPFYTFAQFCSPCIPGGCNLDSPLDVTLTRGEWTVENELAAQAHCNNKCFALGHDWFDGGKAPYRVFRVADSTEVQP